VVEAFRRNYVAYPNGDALISRDTQITAVDTTTVELKTPQPTGVFPNALTSSNFIIHKSSTPGGTDATICTGPYRATSLAVDDQMVLEPFADHWAGPPPIARITVKKVVDPNTEILALQSGETDLVFRVPPEVVRGLGADFTIASIPAGIVDSVEINLTRQPLGDRAVREALAWGLDRNLFVTLGLDGQGAPATGVFPPNIGVDSVAVQGFDLNRAKRVLDDAGWSVGSDGVRAKNGMRLAFTLLNPDITQAELAPMSVSVQAQLKPLGFDVKLQQTQDYGGVIKSRDFDALIVSFNSVQTGDPLFQLARSLGKDGSLNWGSYSNPRVEDLLTQLRGELDQARRQALSRQIQELTGADIPIVYLAVAPIVSAYRAGKVNNFTPHPDDTYLIDSNLSVS
jgi:peptide/nickel transport system substrate-binding protein